LFLLGAAVLGKRQSSKPLAIT